jgi:hypothetical protein
LRMAERVGISERCREKPNESADIGARRGGSDHFARATLVRCLPSFARICGLCQCDVARNVTRLGCRRSNIYGNACQRPLGVSPVFFAILLNIFGPISASS